VSRITRRRAQSAQEGPTRRPRHRGGKAEGDLATRCEDGAGGGRHRRGGEPARLADGLVFIMRQWSDVTIYALVVVIVLAWIALGIVLSSSL